MLKSLGWIIALVALIRLWSWNRARKGLDQWPHPHGPRYNEWMKYDGELDYYPWLVHKFGHREPWTRWVELDRAVQRKIAAERDADSV